jgi:ribulose-5-phosphate 4-epimerase/fuculose-1-phosphate aldolase
MNKEKSKNFLYKEMIMNIRLKTSHLYHILAHLSLDDHTYTHASARSEDGSSYYIFPFGLTYSEVTPFNLLKVSLDGEVLEGDEQTYNPTGYIIHGEIYKARSDINCVIHIHTPETVAVSSFKKGLLPMSQWALHFYNKVAYHDYDSLALCSHQGKKMAEDMGPLDTMLLRHHGAIACGRTIHESLFYIYHLQKACETQCLMQTLSSELMTLPSEAICEETVKTLLSFEKDLGKRDWDAWVRLLASKKPTWWNAQDTFS